MNKEFEPNTPVLYVPYHANGNKKHKDVERGIVTGSNEEYVFVRFENDNISKAVIRERLVIDNGDQ
jgi:hypothetical protein